MKKNIIILGLGIILSVLPACSSENNSNACYDKSITPCHDVFLRMYSERATMYNVLGLSPDQSKCKDDIEKNRFQELDVKFNQLAQEKYVLLKLKENNASDASIRTQKAIVKKIENEMKNIDHKYDHQFREILNAEQRSKYNIVKKMERKEIKNCRKTQKLYKQDPHLRPFGQKMYYYETQDVLCPKHHKWHIFGFKCKEN